MQYIVAAASEVWQWSVVVGSHFQKGKVYLMSVGQLGSNFMYMCITFLG